MCCQQQVDDNTKAGSPLQAPLTVISGQSYHQAYFGFLNVSPKCNSFSINHSPPVDLKGRSVDSFFIKNIKKHFIPVAWIPKVWDKQYKNTHKSYPICQNMSKYSFCQQLTPAASSLWLQLATSLVSRDCVRKPTNRYSVQYLTDFDGNISLDTTVCVSLLQYSLPICVSDFKVNSLLPAQSLLCGGPLIVYLI